MRKTYDEKWILYDNRNRFAEWIDEGYCPRLFQSQVYTQERL